MNNNSDQPTELDLVEQFVFAILFLAVVSIICVGVMGLIDSAFPPPDAAAALNHALDDLYGEHHR